MTHAPWESPEWVAHADEQMTEALHRAGRPPTGAGSTVKKWARSLVRTIPTAAGTVWVKHSYRLPPGEEVVVGELFPRYSDSAPNCPLPDVIAHWPGGYAMEPILGEELTAEHPLEVWVRAAETIAKFAAAERAHAAAWVERGVRDRRPSHWQSAVEALLESPVLGTLDAEVRRGLDRFVPDFIDRYVRGFRSPATLVHQDSGSCNLHLTPTRCVLFDWADVIVGHATFSCDRLLDQAPSPFHAPVIEAFCRGAEIPLEEFRAMRRSNVLHEVLRYHDELAHIDRECETAHSLARSVRSQIEVLIAHETKRASKSDP